MKFKHKLDLFNFLKKQGVPTPNTTKDINQAVKWIVENDSVVVVDVLSGRNKDTCYAVKSLHDLYKTARSGILWTEYFTHKDEYLVCIEDASIVDAQLMSRKGSTSVICVRAFRNKWGFDKYDIVKLPPEVANVALAAAISVGEPVTAVKVAWNIFTKQPCVLNVYTKDKKGDSKTFFNSFLYDSIMKDLNKSFGVEQEKKLKKIVDEYSSHAAVIDTPVFIFPTSTTSSGNTLATLTSTSNYIPPQGYTAWVDEEGVLQIEEVPNE